MTKLLSHIVNFLISYDEIKNSVFSVRFLLFEMMGKKKLHL